MIVLDTSGLFAALDADERLHEAAAAALRMALPPLVLSPFVLAELDYLVSTRIGRGPQMDLLDEVSRGAYELSAFESTDVAEACRIMRRYEDLGIGLTDASVIVLASRFQTRDILTLDERHFRVMHARGGKPFRLWPADLQ